MKSGSRRAFDWRGKQEVEESVWGVFWPLDFYGSHGLIGKVTLVVDLDGLADELQAKVHVLFPLELQQPEVTRTEQWFNET